ncbi:MAG TPA: hypothetical protein VKK31_28745 [Thermoanaerobaculia bacterium]|nr:hypothetical protein [Thermoanaerobaculia bacterium]
MNSKKSTIILVLAVMLLAVPAFAGKVSKMDKLSMTCGTTSATSINIMACAGPNTGAPAGFSLQWVSADQFALGPDGLPGTLDDGTWPDSSSLSLCKASFSGNANGSAYNLGRNACTTVQAGDNLFDDPGASSNCASIPLECSTDYVFRSFAHANSTLFRSDFSANLTCRTSECIVVDGCTFTQGYWKTHGPMPTGNNTNEWPVTELTLGNVSYTDLQLQSIFDTPAQGNGLISLAHQLIAAKLNIANGANDSSVAAAVAAADALIGNLVIPPVGSGSLAPSATSSLTATLTSFNEGSLGPGHC